MYPQFDSKGGVGSIHSSSVLLKVKESGIPEEEAAGFTKYRLPLTKRAISSSRTHMEICGGQGYLPQVKSNTLTEQRQQTEKLTHLPLLMSRLLTSPCGSFDQDKKKVTQDIINKFATLDSLLKTIRNEVKNSGKNNVRFEFFVTSTLRNKTCDITLPVPEPWDLLSTIDHDVFKEHWSERLLVYQKPLQNFVNDLKVAEKADKKLLVQKMSAGIRTTLVLCTERCVEAANLIGFRGRVIQLIWGELSHKNYNRDYYILPATCLEASLPHKYALYNPMIATPNDEEESQEEEVEEDDGKGERSLALPAYFTM
jgi:hypothetical protein